MQEAHVHKEAENRSNAQHPRCPGISTSLIRRWKGVNEQCSVRRLHYSSWLLDFGWNDAPGFTCIDRKVDEEYGQNRKAYGQCIVL
jgi:hypothetical protein